MNNTQRSFFFICLGFFVFLFISCGEKSDKAVILELMDKAGQYIEQKDADSLMLFVAEDYSDFRGRNKRETEEMAKHYFLEYQGIITHVLSTKIDEITPAEASIRTDMLVSSGGAQLFRKFVKFAGDYYRIKARLVKREGTWLLHYAEWEYISLDSLFPESVSILKKIFPNVSP
ncbi:MAG: hypothetical protein KAT01_09365 [Candidatus Aminicenantes bacterium]|nr:hypothetical protein [Candidatus Aminicenantes bacterium]